MPPAAPHHADQERKNKRLASFKNWAKRPSWRAAPFVVVFALIGAYVLIGAHATDTVLQVVEAESLQVSTSSDYPVATYSDASGGSALLMKSNSTASGTATVNGATTSLFVTTRGTSHSYCGGAWPHFVVAVDNMPLLTSYANSSSSWVNYSAPVSISAGTHKLTVTFDNDYHTRKCDRNLVVDKVTFVGSSSTPIPAPPPPSPPPTTTNCTLFASTTGSDSNAGTQSSPFATTQKLADSLKAGQIGCLRGGSYIQDVKVGHGGASGSPLVLQSYPGETATITGRLWIAKGADYVTLQNLHLVGNPNNANDLPSPQINANYVTLTGDDISNAHTSICVGVGSEGPLYGASDHVTITNNRIHDCGILPASNHEHGIYVEDATNLVIGNNFIYNNADRGIQFYPDLSGSVISGVDVYHNVIDSNGQGILFSGNNGSSASNINVHNNLITFSNVRNNVESYYPSGTSPGTNNIVQQNCIYGGVRGTSNGGIDTSAGGFTLSNNLLVNPLYVNAGAQDYSLQSTSPCAQLFANTNP